MISDAPANSIFPTISLSYASDIEKSTAPPVIISKKQRIFHDINYN